MYIGNDFHLFGQFYLIVKKKLSLEEKYNNHDEQRGKKFTISFLNWVLCSNKNFYI